MGTVFLFTPPQYQTRTHRIVRFTNKDLYGEVSPLEWINKETFFRHTQVKVLQEGGLFGPEKEGNKSNPRQLDSLEAMNVLF